jgi:naphtho-gamma-pyrone polyketide synthase
VLQAFLATTSLRYHNLTIESPYHAPHLYGPEDINEIVGGFHDEVLHTYRPRMSIISASSGEPIAAKNFHDLLLHVVSDTLIEPIRWDGILSFVSEQFLPMESKRACTVYPISSGVAHLLISKLNKCTNLEITINDSMNTGVTASQNSRATGKFEQSKIAIVGYSGRFPESANSDEFWDLLRDGRDVHRTIPEDRFDWKAHFDPTGKQKNTSRVQYGCFIKEPGLFDARFFNMSPRESENTDPAQRLAITATYEALEMSGIVPNRTPSTQQDRIGVFFGVTSDDWREVNSGQDVDTYFIPGGNRAFVPGRIR